MQKAGESGRNSASFCFSSFNSHEINFFTYEYSILRPNRSERDVKNVPTTPFIWGCTPAPLGYDVYLS